MYTLGFDSSVSKHGCDALQTESCPYLRPETYLQIGVVYGTSAYEVYKSPGGLSRLISHVNLGF